MNMNALTKPSNQMSGSGMPMNGAPGQAAGIQANAANNTPVATTLHGIQANNYLSGVALDQFGRPMWGAAAPQSNLQKLQGSQADYANNFRTNLPQTEQQMQDVATSQAGAQLNNTQRQVSTNNASRGLLYGGVNAGQQGQVQQAAGAQLSQTVSKQNQGLINEAQALDNQAINTGIQIQQQQQSMQNQIYQQAMNSMNNMNSVTGGVMGLIGTGAMVAAFA